MRRGQDFEKMGGRISNLQRRENLSQDHVKLERAERRERRGGRGGLAQYR